METSCKSPKACQKRSWLATNSCTNVLNNLLFFFVVFSFFFSWKYVLFPNLQQRNGSLKFAQLILCSLGAFKLHWLLWKKSTHTHKVIVVSWKPQALSSGHIRQSALIFGILLDLVSWGFFYNFFSPTKHAIFSPSPRAHRITLNHHFIWLFCCLS